MNYSIEQSSSVILVVNYLVVIILDTVDSKIVKIKI